MKKNHKNICLTGFMGVGKTSVGQDLAEKLNMDFFDTDSLIEKKEGAEIPEIFEKKGEPYFRKVEEEVVLENLNKRNAVIALGGGAFLNQKIRDVAKDSFVICLSMSLNAFLNRLEEYRETRPVLKGKSIDEVKELYKIRKACYRQNDIDILVDKLSVEEAVNNILESFEDKKMVSK
jgi:shikimate kinase